MSGVRVVYRPVGDTSGICCRKAISRKKQFEYRRNCSNRNSGTKDRRLKQNNKQDEFNIYNFLEIKGKTGDVARVAKVPRTLGEFPR